MIFFLKIIGIIDLFKNMRKFEINLFYNLIHNKGSPVNQKTFFDNWMKTVFKHEKDRTFYRLFKNNNIFVITELSQLIVFLKKFNELWNEYQRIVNFKEKCRKYKNKKKRRYEINFERDIWIKLSCFCMKTFIINKYDILKCLHDNNDIINMLYHPFNFYYDFDKLLNNCIIHLEFKRIFGYVLEYPIFEI